MPATLAMHDMGLSTVIGLENTDASGRSLQSSMKTTVERLRTWDRRSQVHESVDRNLRQAFSELDRLAEKLNVSDAVIEKAAYIYRKAIEKKLIRGRSISGLIAASLYAAFRNTETPRTFEGRSIGCKHKEKGARAILQASTERNGSPNACRRSDKVCFEDRKQSRSYGEDKTKSHRDSEKGAGNKDISWKVPMGLAVRLFTSHASWKTKRRLRRTSRKPPA